MAITEHPSHCNNRSPARLDWVKYLVVIIGAASEMLGLLVLFAWWMHWTAVLQLGPTLPPMQFNAAVGFVLVGMAFHAWAFSRTQWTVPLFAGAITLLGGLTGGEYLCGANPGIDEMFFRSYLAAGTDGAARMAPNTALCFTLTGLAFLALGLDGNWRWRARIAGTLASMIVSITIVALFGYALGLPGTYGWGHWVGIAIHTALGLCLVGIGLFTIAWKMARRPGEFAPRWLPLPVALGVFTAALVLCFALESMENQEIAQMAMVHAQSVRNQLTSRMDSRFRAFERMAKRWEFSGATAQAAWEADATSYVNDFPDIKALQWMDATHHIRWIVPLAGNEAKLNLDLTQEPNRRSALELAEREGKPVITRTVTLLGGKLGFVIYEPVVIGGRPHGFIAASFEASTCIKGLLPPSLADGENIAISEGGHVFFQRGEGAPPKFPAWIVETKLNLPGATWVVRTWPTSAVTSRLQNRLPEVVLGGGLIGSLLLAAVCFLAQRFARQATATAHANAKLQGALDEVKTLSELLPICSCCKRVRDDTGYWSQIDAYLHKHMDASFSHGYCPACAAKTFKEFGFEVPEDVQAEIDAGKSD